MLGLLTFNLLASLLGALCETRARHLHARTVTPAVLAERQACDAARHFAVPTGASCTMLRCTAPRHTG